MTAEGRFNPAFHFLGLVQKALADGVTRHCRLASSPDVYLVPSEQVYYTGQADIEALQSLCLAAPFDVSVEMLPNWHPDAGQDVQAGRMLIHKKIEDSQALEKRPLSELLWYAALMASDGRLLLGHHAETPMRLSALPDFSGLYYRDCDLVIAANMLENSAPLTDIATATGTTLAEVIDFYNACATIGLLDGGDQDQGLFQPAHYLSGLLELAIADKQMRRCELPGKAFLYLAPGEGKYYTDANKTMFALLCKMPLAELVVEIVDTHSNEEEVVQIGRTRVRRKKAFVMPKLPEHPLSELQFRAALYASQGRLLPGHTITKPVHLKAWPDKALLKEASTNKEERYIFQLAALMTTKTATLEEFSKVAQLPLVQVIDFHNACALTGLLA